MHHRRRSRSKSTSPGNSTSTSSRSPFTPSPAATPSISYRQNGDNDSPSPVPLGGTGIVTSTTIVQSTSSAISQSTTSLASLSYLGIGDRTRKRLSVTATSSRAAVAERTDEERAFESRRRATFLAWEKCVDDDFDYAVPWRRRHLLRLFSQIDVGGPNATGGGGGGAPEGDHLDSTMLLLSQEVVDRISSLLRRPLVRVGTESQRLAARYGRCSRHEVIVAAKLVLPPALAEQAIQAAVRAYSLYGVSAQRFAYSKSARSGLVLPAGAVHRWMLDSSVARVVSECASLYLCAVLESLAEEIYRRVVLEPNDEVRHAPS